MHDRTTAYGDHDARTSVLKRWLGRGLQGLALGSIPVFGGWAASQEQNPIAWSPPGISSDAFESHAAFDPVSQDVYFVRSSKAFTGWRILVARCSKGQYAEPVPAPFGGPGVEADPGFSPDGNRLYYISTRSQASQKSQDLDIWMVQRTKAKEWGAPVRLPEPVNSDKAEWFPRLAPDGWLYFGSNRDGGFGGNDIWRARARSDGRWDLENAGPNINSAQDEYEPLPSPDGKTLLIEAADGYYISVLAGGQWSARTRLGRAINANGSEVGATFSPSGRSILFARDTGVPGSGEFFVWAFKGKERWPTGCGEKSR